MANKIGQGAILIVPVANPGKGNKGMKVILNLMTLGFEFYASGKEAAEAYGMCLQTLLRSRKARESKNIRLIGVDCTYSEAQAFVEIVRLAQKGFKKVEKCEKEF